MTEPTNLDLLNAIHDLDKKIDVHVARDESEWQRIKRLEKAIAGILTTAGAAGGIWKFLL